MGKTIIDKMPNENPALSFDEKEIDLHIAEYNALTTRSTYFINIQFVLLTALIAWIIVIGNIWNTKLEYLLNWALLIGAQLLGIINAIMIWESYCIISYIENDLKPKICNIIKNKTLWGYEPFLLKLREKKQTKISMIFIDFFGTIMAGIIIIATVIYRFHNWISWDWLGCFINVLLFVALFIWTYQTVKLKVNSWK
jgi:hypothetical protein